MRKRLKFTWCSSWSTWARFRMLTKTRATALMPDAHDNKIKLKSPKTHRRISPNKRCSKLWSLYCCSASPVTTTCWGHTQAIRAAVLPSPSNTGWGPCRGPQASCSTGGGRGWFWQQWVRCNTDRKLKTNAQKTKSSHGKVWLDLARWGSGSNKESGTRCRLGWRLWRPTVGHCALVF